MQSFVLENESGGYYHPGKKYDFAKKLHVGRVYNGLCESKYPLLPAISLVAEEAGVSPWFAHQVVDELLVTGELQAPDFDRIERVKLGPGSQCLNQEEEDFLLDFRKKYPTAPNTEYCRQLFRNFGTKVSKSFISYYWKKRYAYPATFKKANLVPLDKFRNKT